LIRKTNDGRKRAIRFTPALAFGAVKAAAGRLIGHFADAA
jgi:hypothetical protein